MARINTNTRDSEIVPDLHVLQVDTTSYVIRENLPKKVQKIFGESFDVYLFDLSERTYLASMQPSIYGVYLYSRVLTSVDYDSLTESQREAINDLEIDFESDTELGTYFDYEQIERAIAAGEGKKVKLSARDLADYREAVEEVGYEEAHRELLDDVTEDERGSPSF